MADSARRWAREQPHAPAFSIGESTLTYAELDAASSRAATALLARGVVPGSGLVAFVGRNSLAYGALQVGCAKARAGLVGLNWRLTAGELAVPLADARPAVVVADAAMAPLVSAALEAAGVRSALLTIGGTWEAALGEAAPADPGLAADPGDTAMVFFTSGTTGAPKGAVLSARGMANAIARPMGWRTLGPGRVALAAPPVFHMAGAAWVAITVTFGSHLVLVREPSPAAMVEAIERHGVHHLIVVPAMIRALVDHARAEPDARPVLPTLRTIAYGASPISPGLLAEAFATFGCDFVQTYGMSEAGGSVTNLSPDDHRSGDAHLLRSAGRALPGVELRIVDPERAVDVGVGEVGEVWIRCDQLMAGYLNRPDASAQALTADGWLRTGDAGSLDAAGYLYIVDRINDMIVSGAENVYPLEVEHVLAAHPGVAEAAVVGGPHERWGETPVAYVRWRGPGGREAADADAVGLIEWCRARLAHFKCPTRVVFVDDLPRNATGKVLRRVLRAREWAGHDRQVG